MSITFSNFSTIICISTYLVISFVSIYFLALPFRLAHYPEEWIGLRKNDTNGEGFYWLDGTTLAHCNLLL